MKTDTLDFLAALLWAYPEDETGQNPMEGFTAHDFSPAFQESASRFLSGFRTYLAEREIPIPDSGFSLGHGVYFSLSGHGCGFWDSSETEHLQAPLEAYSGNRYRFEEIDLMADESGLLDLAILPEHRAEYRSRLFDIPTRQP